MSSDVIHIRLQLTQDPVRLKNVLKMPGVISIDLCLMLMTFKLSKVI